jgi:osmotically-inducible protein OsmY
MQRKFSRAIMAAATLALAFAALAQDATAPVKQPDPTLLTPMDQGNNKADLATTADIRKEIIATKTMSVNAQNVKIITNAGKVTLRGPVNSADEKRLIGEIAGRQARPENIDNQLEVNVATNNLKGK